MMSVCIFLTGAAWQESSYHSALILGLCDALALSQSQCCQNNLAGTPKARKQGPAQGWDDGVMRTVLANPLAPFTAPLSSVPLLVSVTLLSSWLSGSVWWLRWTWHGGGIICDQTYNGIFRHSNTLGLDPALFKACWEKPKMVQSASRE